MHRLQPVHLPLRAQRADRLHAESDGVGGIPARLASGAGRAGIGAASEIAVVGAGPAGLECALTLGRRGHEVELLEATPHLGGHLRDVVRLPGLAEWGRVISWRETQLDKLANVTVRRGVGMVTAEDLLDYGMRARRAGDRCALGGRRQ